MKHCPKCLILKDKSAFYINSKKADGLDYICKTCQSVRAKIRRSENTESIANVKKQWYSKNKDKALSYAKQYYEQNKQQIITKIVDYRRKKIKSDPVFKLHKTLRHRLGKLIKQQSSSIAINFLGCSVVEFKAYLESKFQPGMTWENHGKWHIDHIKPLSSFDLNSAEELSSACHYSNLQPLWAKDNLSKGDKLV